MKAKFEELLKRYGEKGWLLKEEDDFPIVMVVEPFAPQKSKTFSLRGQVLGVSHMGYMPAGEILPKRKEEVRLGEHSYRIEAVEVFTLKGIVLYYKLWLMEKGEKSD